MNYDCKKFYDTRISVKLLQKIYLTMGRGKNKLEPFSCIRNVNAEDEKGLATTGQRS
jgi:hypothetical protein